MDLTLIITGKFMLKMCRKLFALRGVGPYGPEAMRIMKKPKHYQKTHFVPFVYFMEKSLFGSLRAGGRVIPEDAKWDNVRDWRL
ncbi:MAG: hypothetical protein H8D67_21330 [Deltaproteobacteria bacterium]|nr:hypothetical protein [Deltaproteobacteria bacterium]